MIDRLYVARGDRTAGPFSAAQLRGLAAAGRIRPTDAVWREGAIDKAVDAAKVKTLFPSPPTLAHGEGADSLRACEPSSPSPADGRRPPSSAARAPSDSPPAPLHPPGNPGEIGPEPMPVQTAFVPAAAPVLLEAADPTSQGRAVPTDEAKAPRPPPPPPPRKRRAVALNGAVILSQDGVDVQYRKKCSLCGFEDRCRSSMRIGNGMTRLHFYCPECRKGRDVQIQGIMQ